MFVLQEQALVVRFAGSTEQEPEQEPERKQKQDQKSRYGNPPKALQHKAFGTIRFGMESPKKRKIFGKNGQCCLKNRQLVVESTASMLEDERERDRNFGQQPLNGNAIEISVSSL